MLAPGALALVVLGFFYVGLQREDARNLPSTLIDRPAPDFALDPLYPGKPGLGTADLKQPGAKLVNIWASWCGPCRVEHPMLEALADEGITIHGINYKDDPANAKQFLTELGDPYQLIGADQSGRAGIEWGVYGVPETFVIDGAGNVIYKHIGPIQPGDVESKIRPALEKAAGQ
ncbi:DsbE family thiol:disulfide interchange protein [Rhodobacteraceae bacterium NNCM2]|nr:DsbE family thiol:disulfide interchange protein [Coraliihabitans acroporae]